MCYFCKKKYGNIKPADWRDHRSANCFDPENTHGKNYRGHGGKGNTPTPTPAPAPIFAAPNSCRYGKGCGQVSCDRDHASPRDPTPCVCDSRFCTKTHATRRSTPCRYSTGCALNLDGRCEYNHGSAHAHAHAHAPARAPAPAVQTGLLYKNPVTLTTVTSRGDDGRKRRSIFEGCTVRRPARAIPSTGFAFAIVEHELGVLPIGRALYKKQPGCILGLGVAANHGRPLGGLGVGVMTETRPITSLVEKAQEEHVTSDWMVTSYGPNPKEQSRVWRALQETWGLSDLDQNSTSRVTNQGVDYSVATPEEYHEAYVVDQVQMVSDIEKPGNKPQIKEGVDAVYPVALVFGAGPCTTVASPTGSMARTFNPKAAADYEYFKACQKEAISGVIDAMANSGVTIPLLPLISCGVYAKGVKGISSVEIYLNYLQLVDEVLREPVGPNGEMVAQYFDNIVIPEFTGFQKRLGLLGAQPRTSVHTPAAAAAPAAAVARPSQCRYGKGCGQAGCTYVHDKHRDTTPCNCTSRFCTKTHRAKNGQLCSFGTGCILHREGRCEYKHVSNLS